MSVGKSILRIRLERGMTQGEVGERARLATSYISRIENDHVQPTMATLGRLARALRVQVSAIFRADEHGDDHVKQRCPVSASGQCIGQQIRSEKGRRPRREKASYGREDLRLLRMVDYIALHGSKATRSALGVVLDSMVQRVHPRATVKRPGG
ncbi:MAG: helix-turn-helix transcriptional regulator [bacterium]|nr:helix-turn-helix transcriptional regulator [bacterium]